MLLLWSSYVVVGSRAMTLPRPAARVPMPADEDEDGIIMFAPPPDGWRIVSPRKVTIYKDTNDERQ